MPVSATTVPIVTDNVEVTQTIAAALLQQVPELNPCAWRPSRSVEVLEPGSSPETDSAENLGLVTLMFVCTDPPASVDPRSTSAPSLLQVAKLFAAEKGLRVVGISSVPETLDQLSEAGCVFVGTLPNVIAQIAEDLPSWLGAQHVP